MAIMDKMNAISMFEFKQNLPVMEDTDPDLDRHDRLFWNMVSCYQVSGRGPRDVHVLYMYQSGFKEGSTRRPIFNLAYSRAVKARRIPNKLTKCG